MVKRRIFISVPTDDHLDEANRELVHAVLRLISKAGLSRSVSCSLACPPPWHGIFRQSKVMRQCVDAVIFALPRTMFGEHCDSDSARDLVPTEWNHYEGAVANTLRLPTLILAETGIPDKGIA